SLGVVLGDLAEALEDPLAAIPLVGHPVASRVDEDAFRPGSHSSVPFLGLRLPGRPRAEIYASAQASSSWRSKAMPRSPMGISVSCGRISSSKRARSVPR